MKENTAIEQKEQNLNKENDINCEEKATERKTQNLPNEDKKKEESENIEIQKQLESSESISSNREKSLDKKDKVNGHNAYKDNKSNNSEGFTKSMKEFFIAFCSLCGLILCTILIILSELAFHFILSRIFIYYKNNCKECKAELYLKVDIILYIYLALLIIVILIILVKILVESIKKDHTNLLVFFGILMVILFLANLGLELALIIVVQIGYNQSENWENCGNLKIETIVWLVFNYIGLVLSFIKKCYDSCKKKEEEE